MSSLLPYKSFTFRLSNNTGGKAGKGFNQTRSFYAFSEKYMKGRYFSFYHQDPVDMMEVYMMKARPWIDKTIKAIEKTTESPNPIK
jgi:hypothetical protein